MCGERDLSDGEAKVKIGMMELRTNLVVELWQLHLHLLSLKQMVLCLFTHWRNQIELSGHGVGFLSRVGKRWGGVGWGEGRSEHSPYSSAPLLPIEWGLEWPCEKWALIVEWGSGMVHSP